MTRSKMASLTMKNVFVRLAGNFELFGVRDDELRPKAII
jgi:hypothetical protein